MTLGFGLLVVGTVIFIIVWSLWTLGGLTELHLRDAFSLVEVAFSAFVSMFSRDRWGEVFDTIRRNKLRTALTAVSVAWGIFVMVVLLGMGEGLNNGIRYSFRSEAENFVDIHTGRTSKPYAGYTVGRKLTFQNRDYDHLASVPGIEHTDGAFYIQGNQWGGGALKVQRGGKSSAFEIQSVFPGDYYTAAYAIAEGRYLNDDDIKGLRKVAVIGRPVRDFLFARDAMGSDVEDPLGQWIVVNGVPFEVVGVFTCEGSEEQERAVYIPATTAQLAFNGADRLGAVAFTVGDASVEETHAITKQVIDQLAASHQFDPSDTQAVHVFDTVEGFHEYTQMFFVISMFVLVIGFGTLAAGVVGVSNIMMIAVKERTKEIGIRKALGATPVSIVAMIVQEAVFLTSISGLLGLSSGVAFLGLVPKLVDTDLIRDPSIHISTGVAAAIGLVIAGALAGFVPARAAAKVNPIQTLRDE